MTLPGPGDPPPGRQEVRRIVSRYVPIVDWLPAYDRGNLRFDAIAGVVSWGVMVPVAMAYAGLAGMPPETGLVTAFAALTAYLVEEKEQHFGDFFRMFDRTAALLWEDAQKGAGEVPSSVQEAQVQTKIHLEAAHRKVMEGTKGS